MGKQLPIVKFDGGADGTATKEHSATLQTKPVLKPVSELIKKW